MIFRVYSKKLKKHVWGFRVALAGQRIRRAGFETKAKAEEAKVAIRKKYLHEYCGMEIEHRERTLGELVEARRKDAATSATITRLRVQGWFESFVAFAGSDSPVRDVSSARLKQFRDQMLSRVQASTTQARMQYVIACLNSSRLYFSDMDDYRAPRLPHLKTSSRVKVVPLSELHAVVDELTSRGHTLAADVLELLMLTGCRVGEVLSLKRSNLDFERQVILLRAEDTKTRCAREIPLSEASESILRRLNGSLPSYPYFHALVRSAANERGILFGYENWIIHDIRRTVGTRLAEAGISQSIIAALLGHSLSGVTAIYTRPTLEAVRHAVTILADLWSSNIIHFPQKRAQI
jgi:integrase